jgi:hypothetical protein
MNAPPSLLVNDVRNSNHWIAFHLIGTSYAATSQTLRTNRNAIGARITMKAGPRLFVDEVRSGSSYDSNSDMRVHFGVGSATKLDSVQIRWPSGLVETFDNLAIDKIHSIKEGSGTAPTPKPQK